MFVPVLYFLVLCVCVLSNFCQLLPIVISFIYILIVFLFVKRDRKTTELIARMSFKILYLSILLSILLSDFYSLKTERRDHLTFMCVFLSSFVTKSLSIKKIQKNTITYFLCASLFYLSINFNYYSFFYLVCKQVSIHQKDTEKKNPTPS